MGSSIGGPGKRYRKEYDDTFTKYIARPADVGANLTTATDLAYQAAVSSLSGPYIMCE